MGFELDNAQEVTRPIAISNDRDPQWTRRTAIVEPTTCLSVNRLELFDAGRLKLDDLDETSHDPSLSPVSASVALLSSTRKPRREALRDS